MLPAASRLRLVFMLLLAVFAALVAAACIALVLRGDALLAGVAAFLGFAGAAAAGLTYLAVREDADEAQPLSLPVTQPVAQPARTHGLARPAMRVHAMPVADLPPAYVAAVLHGVRTRTAALKQQARIEERRTP